MAESVYARAGLLYYEDHLVIPKALREKVLDILHAAHQGIGSMQHRASQTVYWPGITADIKVKRLRCATCTEVAPSQVQVPTEQSCEARMPFESIAADYFDLNGVHFLVTVDRLSGWLDVTRAASGTSASGVAGLIACLRQIFADKGVPETLSSDRGLEFMSHVTQEFLRKWDVRHRLSSAHFPQSNGRAEAAVKSAKRLLRGHVTKSGSLNVDAFVLAIMAHRNTPDPVMGLSPAEALYGRKLRDAFQFALDADRNSRSKMSPTWREAWDLKERANRHRFY